MNKALAELKSNLHSGLKLMLWRSCRLQDFHINIDQAVLLLILALLVNILGDYLTNLPAPYFSVFGFAGFGFSLTCLLFACYLIGKIIDRRDALLSLLVLLYSSMPLLYLTSTTLWLLQRYSEVNFSVYAVTLLYYALLAALLSRPVQLVARPLKRYAWLGIVLFALLWIAPAYYFDRYDFWYQEERDNEEDPYAEYRALNAEQILFNQARILSNHLGALQPGRKGRIDVFSVNFAGYAYQDVFKKEVEYTQDLLDRRFGARGHSIRLINHLKTYQSVPLASATNLAASLNHIGRLMNRDEDVLILYLSSHGSEDHQLAVDFWPLPLNDINPEMLKTMLDDAGIRWRIIVISACYSGGFIAPLQTDHTLIATAAASERTSFGCSHENDFTYFGEALVKDQLRYQFSFVKAFQLAAENIAKREMAEQLTPSQPQLFIGAQMQKKLPN
nr:C13 family peptidase [Methylomarinum sp. Ch1-1]MDP4519395.1 C13 family peptidase [Methylomarinum sp. Ch1-1]